VGEPFGAALDRVSAHGIEPGLAVTAELLRQLGNPQTNQRIIHIAGTNGKGSVSAMLERCLREAGYKTGLYTSPHIIRYNERFRLGGRLATDGELLTLLATATAAAERVERALGKRPTQFEMLTAMAFLWLSQEKAEVAILETGMGGRFDATNIITRPLLTIITNVSLDHEQFLGDTIPAIAREKAGIIKAGAPLVCAAGDPAAMAIIKATFAAAQAAAVGASAGGASPDEASSGGASLGDASPGGVRPNEASSGGVNPRAAGPAPLLASVWEECSWTTTSLGLDGQIVNLSTPGDTYPDLSLPLAGQHQCVNLACVVRAWEILSPVLPGLGREALYRGVAAVRWPCRLEKVQEDPAVVLDGSHNPDGIRHLALWLSENRAAYQKVILVMGMVADKDRLAAAGYLDGLVSQVIITKPLSDRAGDWRALAEGFRVSGQAEYIEDCLAALDVAMGRAVKGDLVLCTGSFYLVGELRQKWAPQDPDGIWA
jgi:dihydrofolate synthase/folylpolyglutamate synthase